MDFLQHEVTHKAFGTGRIVALDGACITIGFTTGEKRFEFPSAFRDFLSATDPTVAAEIEELLNVSEAENLRVQQEKAQAWELACQPPVKVPQPRASTRASKPAPPANIAFKCNFCDGGQSDAHVGFAGICSDRAIHNNTVVNPRKGCILEGSPCLQYQSGQISRHRLEEICEQNGPFCYEMSMLLDWKAFAGIVESGKSKGEKMKLKQIQRNRLCMLTTRDPKTTEWERYVFAVFLIDDLSEGDGKQEGYVAAHPEYRIALTPAEAHRMLFWTYYANTNHPPKAFWGTGLFRYFENGPAAQILRDLAALKVGTPDEELAARFYEHFCTINGVNPDSLGAACGALRLPPEDAPAVTSAPEIEKA